jgi:nicotinamide phosphoribosyltransferase
MVAYGEFRSGYEKDTKDTRLIFYGLRYTLENYLLRQWTVQDVECADKFFRTHMAPGYTQFPYPKELFLKFVNENNGYFPVKLEALQEGSVIHAHVPVYQITAETEYSHLCTFLETVLTMVWYPSTVATLSRRCRDVIAAAFDQSVDSGRASPVLGSRLHDFGFRGCTCVEQSVLGGTAHLLNFEGSDALSAEYYAQFMLNDGEPVGNSIPGTEHSVMTAWPDEKQAISNMIDHYGHNIFACVMDSYDYARALSEVLPAIATKKVGAGGYMVLRPDSGDPVETVLMGLRAAEKVFGADVNSKGYKVIRRAGVLQGDGINIDSLTAIMKAVLDAGYSAESVGFGMGSGLLQKVNRDTMSFATKLSHIVYSDKPGGRPTDIMKLPKTDSSKISLPGVLAVKRVDGVPTVFPAKGGHVMPKENLLQVVYDCGPVPVHWEKFSVLKQRVARDWEALQPSADVISQPLKDKIQQLVQERAVLKQ